MLNVHVKDESEIVSQILKKKTHKKLVIITNERLVLTDISKTIFY